MPCLFLDPGKVTAILWKAIYHPPILSFRPLLVLSHSPLKPKMSSFQWAFFFCPAALASLSDVSQIEIRPKGQNSYRPPAASPVAASGNTEKRSIRFLKMANRREMWRNVLSLTSELAFINTVDNQCQDTDGEFEQNIISDFLFFQNNYVFHWARQIFAYWVRFYIYVFTWSHCWIIDQGKMVKWAHFVHLPRKGVSTASCCKFQADCSLSFWAWVSAFHRKWKVTLGREICMKHTGSLSEKYQTLEKLHPSTLRVVESREVSERQKNQVWQMWPGVI